MVYADGPETIVGEDESFALQGLAGQLYWELAWKKITYMYADVYTMNFESQEDFDGFKQYQDSTVGTGRYPVSYTISPSAYSAGTESYTVTDNYRYEMDYLQQDYEELLREATDPATGISDVQITTPVTEETNADTVEYYRGIHSADALTITQKVRISSANLVITETDELGNTSTARVLVNAHIHDLEKLPEALYESCVNYRCRICGKIFTDAVGTHEADMSIPAANHVAAAMHTYAADCTNAGAAGGSYCKVCGQVLQAGSVVPPSHTFGEWKVTTEATALKEGEMTRTCSVCGRQETKAIPKLPPEKETEAPSKPEPEEEAQKASISLRVGNIQVNDTVIPLKKKQKLSKIKAVMGEGDSILRVTSSKAAVCKASVNGIKIVLKAGKKTGKATITVETSNGAKTSFKVKVQKKTVAAKKIVGWKKKLVLKKGKTYQLPADVSPVSTPGKLKFRSSNKSAAAVSSRGLIKAKKKGTASITATIGKKRFICKVTVKN